MKNSANVLVIILFFLSQSAICQTNVIYYKNVKDSTACNDFLRNLELRQFTEPEFENYPELQNETQSLHKLRKIIDSISSSKHAASAILITTIVDTLGDVKCIQFMSPLGNAVNNQIIAVIKDWKFRPAAHNKKPIEFEYQFSLKIKK
jgi:hypothetical protein